MALISLRGGSRKSTPPTKGSLTDRSKKLERLPRGDLVLAVETALMSAGRLFDLYMREGKGMYLDQAAAETLLADQGMQILASEED